MSICDYFKTVLIGETPRKASQLASNYPDCHVLVEKINGHDVSPPVSPLANQTFIVVRVSTDHPENNYDYVFHHGVITYVEVIQDGQIYCSDKSIAN
jgi:hypothetical protein